MWANEETVVGVFTLASRTTGGPGLDMRGLSDSEANTIELRLLLPPRMKVGAVDQLAGVLTGMPRPFLSRLAAGIDLLVRGHGFWGDIHNQMLEVEPKWFTPEMCVKPLKKAIPPAHQTYMRRTLDVQQKRLDIEVARFEDVRAAKQAAIDAGRKKLAPLS